MICPNCQHNQDDSIANCEKCNFDIQTYFQQVANIEQQSSSQQSFSNQDSNFNPYMSNSCANISKYLTAEKYAKKAEGERIFPLPDWFPFLTGGVKDVFSFMGLVLFSLIFFPSILGIVLSLGFLVMIISMLIGMVKFPKKLKEESAETFLYQKTINIDDYIIFLQNNMTYLKFKGFTTTPPTRLAEKSHNDGEKAIYCYFRNSILLKITFDEKKYNIKFIQYNFLNPLILLTDARRSSELAYNCLCPAKTLLSLATKYYEGV